MAPARSACPGRGRVTGFFLSSPPSMSSTGSASVQFFQSLLRMMMAIGRPDGVGVAHAGDDLGAVGLDLHPAAASKALLPPPQFAVDGIQADTGMPAGKPVRVATRHSPCDSPAVSNRNIRL